MILYPLTSNKVIIKTDSEICISVVDNGDHITVQRMISPTHQPTKVIGTHYLYKDNFEGMANHSFVADVVNIKK